MHIFMIHALALTGCFNTRQYCEVCHVPHDPCLCGAFYFTLDRVVLTVCFQANHSTSVFQSKYEMVSVPLYVCGSVSS